MMRNLMNCLVIGSLVFAVACGSKTKKEEDVGGDPGATISGQEMKFNPEGSDSGQISGLASINFDYDRDTLSTKARQTLATNADWIKSNQNVVIQVEGHADARGSVEYNLALGERRAKSVKNYLVSLGIEPQRITVISYGKEKPLVEGDTEAAYSANRRANFVPLPK